MNNLDANTETATATQVRPVPAPGPTPTDPPMQIQRWAELHIDEQVFRLVAPWNLERLQAALESAMDSGAIVKVRAYTEVNGETTLLIRPALAKVVFLAKRPEFVPFGGMPDATKKD